MRKHKRLFLFFVGLSAFILIMASTYIPTVTLKFEHDRSESIKNAKQSILRPVIETSPPIAKAAVPVLALGGAATMTLAESGLGLATIAAAPVIFWAIVLLVTAFLGVLLIKNKDVIIDIANTIMSSLFIEFLNNTDDWKPVVGAVMKLHQKALDGQKIFDKFGNLLVELPINLVELVRSGLSQYDLGDFGANAHIFYEEPFPQSWYELVRTNLEKFDVTLIESKEGITFELIGIDKAGFEIIYSDLEGKWSRTGINPDPNQLIHALPYSPPFISGHVLASGNNGMYFRPNIFGDYFIKKLRNRNDDETRINNIVSMIRYFNAYRPNGYTIAPSAEAPTVVNYYNNQQTKIDSKAKALTTGVATIEIPIPTSLLIEGKAKTAETGAQVNYDTKTGNWVGTSRNITTDLGEDLVWSLPITGVITDASMVDTLIQARAKVDAQVKAKTGTLINVANPAAIGELTNIGAIPGTIPIDTPDVPVETPKERPEINWRQLIGLGDKFKNAFPFAIPFVIGDYLAGSMDGLERSTLPSYTIPFTKGYSITLRIPAAFNQLVSFIKTVLLIIFDVSILYAYRKWIGGQH